jgi:hypothetical protein
MCPCAWRDARLLAVIASCEKIDSTGEILRETESRNATSNSARAESILVSMTRILKDFVCTGNMLCDAGERMFF